MFPDIPVKYIGYLMSRDELSRTEAIDWLSNHQTKNGDQIIILSLSDPNPVVSRFTERKILEKKLELAKDTLISRLTEGLELSEDGIKALGYIGDEQTIIELEQYLESAPGMEEEYAAEEAIERIQKRVLESKEDG